MTTKPRRHKTVEMICKYCGTVFQSLSYRVEEGRGEFCSRSCSSKYQKECVERKYTGKENGKMSFNKVKQEYQVYWFEPGTKKRRSTTYARWWWEMNVGEIPAGCRASYRDGNSLNIDPSNIYIKSKEEFGETLRKVFTGRVFSTETKQKMSKAKTGKPLSPEHKKKIGDASRKLWAEGKFDSVHLGEHNHKWRGGRVGGYPNEYRQIHDFILSRDGFVCRVCGKSPKRLEVHHLDGNKSSNVSENLLTLCHRCHHIVHDAKVVTDPMILILKEMLK